MIDEYLTKNMVEVQNIEYNCEDCVWKRNIEWHQCICIFSGSIGSTQKRATRDILMEPENRFYKISKQKEVEKVPKKMEQTKSVDHDNVPIAACKCY